ncbi:hypothetical protein [Methylomarinum vadi]|uniref:hypothetical protein n=1 Tax=Methylomarinum vadi TaxID=438855 RepID=UPI0004DF3DC3|nr:hypothetical protein [Methylomarinum vadi]
MFLFTEFLHSIIVGLMIVVPVIIIYKRTGLNPIWAALVFLPGFGLLLICLQLALTDWPNQHRNIGDS